MMSDDLERAARAVEAIAICMPYFEGPEHRQCYGLDNEDEVASAALLSFLDMDEAGIERLAGAMFEAHPAYSSTSASARPIKWEHVRDTDASHYWKDKARAVLTELRKMASPTQRDEG